jgi:hypothetical protein
MKIWIVFILNLLIIGCSKNAKENTIVNKLNIAGKIKSVEILNAFTDMDNLEKEVIIEKLPFATNLFQRFDRQKNLLEEIRYSELGYQIVREENSYTRDGKKTTTRKWDEKNELFQIISYFYNEKGEEIKTETYNPANELIEYSITENQTEKKIETFNGEGTKISETIYKYHNEKIVKEKRVQYFVPSKIAKEIYLYNEKGQEIQQIFYNNANMIINQIVNEYNKQTQRSDEYNEKGLISRKELELDLFGNHILESLFIPIFQPKIKKIDWEKEYELDKSIYFKPDNYRFQKVEEMQYVYEFDKYKNWILRKTYQNNKLKEVTERFITYY